MLAENLWKLDVNVMRRQLWSYQVRYRVHLRLSVGKNLGSLRVPSKRQFTGQKYIPLKLNDPLKHGVWNVMKMTWKPCHCSIEDAWHSVYLNWNYNKSNWCWQWQPKIKISKKAHIHEFCAMRESFRLCSCCGGSHEYVVINLCFVVKISSVFLRMICYFAFTWMK